MKNDDVTIDGDLVTFHGRKEGAPHDWTRRFDETDMTNGAVDRWIADRRDAVVADLSAYPSGGAPPVKIRRARK